MIQKRHLQFPALFLALALLLCGCSGGDNTASLPLGDGESAGISSVSITKEADSSQEESGEESLPAGSSLPEESVVPAPAPASDGGPSSASESAPESTPEEVPENSAEASALESAPEPASGEALESSAEASKEIVDPYQTAPVPEGKPEPVEPQEASVDKTAALSCIFSIRCDAILDNLDRFDPDKLSVLPADGVIFAETTLDFYEGESAFDVLLRVTKDNKIHMEFNMTPMYNSAYVEGINNIYEFDCGDLSGWMFKVNGWFPNYGCSRYQLSDGDVVEWVYTCDLGRDVGQEVDGSAG